MTFGRPMTWIGLAPGAVMAVMPATAQQPKPGDVPIRSNWCAVQEVGEKAPQSTRPGHACAINDISIWVECPDLARPTSMIARRVFAGGDASMCGVTLTDKTKRGEDGGLRHRTEFPPSRTFTYLSAVLIRGEAGKPDALAARYSWLGESGPNCIKVFEHE